MYGGENVNIGSGQSDAGEVGTCFGLQSNRPAEKLCLGDGGRVGQPHLVAGMIGWETEEA